MNLKDIVIETANNGTGYIRVSTVVTIFFVALAIVLALYIFRSIAIYKLAKVNGIKLRGLAFVPFAWIYTASLLITEPAFFNKKMKHFALVVLIVFSVCTLITLVYDFLMYFPLVKYYLDGGVITYFEDLTAKVGVQYFENSGICLETGYTLPYSNITLVERLMSVLSIVSLVADIVKEVFLISFYFNFVKSLCPDKLIPYSILSIFGFFPIIAFIIRKNKQVDYATYVKEKYKNFYNVQFTNNPFENKNFNDNQNGFEQDKGEPFSQQAENKSEDAEPFEDFFNKGDKK